MLTRHRLREIENKAFCHTIPVRFKHRFWVCFFYNNRVTYGWNYNGKIADLVGIDDEYGCGEGELAAHQPVFVQVVQVCQVAQRDAGLLATRPRLHTLQSLQYGSRQLAPTLGFATLQEGGIYLWYSDFREKCNRENIV